MPENAQMKFRIIKLQKAKSQHRGPPHKQNESSQEVSSELIQ